jgi:predicted nuclease of predicted toxin-antitoxin system
MHPKRCELRRLIGWALEMRILANENFPGDAVTAMRGAGHDVAWVRALRPGISDVDVLAWGLAEGRILVTFDKDFGELAFKSNPPANCGIILFRIRKQSPEYVANRAVEILNARTDWAGHFSVVEDDRVRMTRLRP